MRSRVSLSTISSSVALLCPCHQAVARFILQTLLCARIGLLFRNPSIARRRANVTIQPSGFALLGRDVLRVIHTKPSRGSLARDLHGYLEQSKNFSSQKGKPLGWMVTLARRRAIDGLRKKQAYARAEERLQNETEQQPDAWAHNATERRSCSVTRVTSFAR